MQFASSSISKRIILVVGAFFALYIFAPFTVIPAGHTGVVTTFGKVSPQALPEGIHLRLPMAQTIYKMPVQILKEETEGDAASKDMQQVTTKIALNYHLEAASTPRIFQSLGYEWSSRLIDPAVSETFKSVTAHYTAEELITRREDVKNEIRQLLKSRLSANGIGVDQINIVNFKFSRSYNEAIERKVTAEQNKLTAERDLERIKVEAKQKIAKAEAEAASLRLQRQEVTAELLRLREIENNAKAIEKWDGKMPQTVAGAAMPFISLGQGK